MLLPGSRFPGLLLSRNMLSYCVMLTDGYYQHGPATVCASQSTHPALFQDPGPRGVGVLPSDPCIADSPLLDRMMQIRKGLKNESIFIVLSYSGPYRTHGIVEAVPQIPDRP